MFDLNFLVYRLISVDGYGRYALHLMRSLMETGCIDASVNTVEIFDHPGWLQRAKGFDRTRLTLSIMPGHELREGIPQQWALSMYESSLLPQTWAGHINSKAQLLIVPCQWCADVFRDNGIDIPIHVIPGGTDPAENPILPPRKIGAQPYTFMALGDRGNRKGHDTVTVAFQEAFKPTDDVRLIIKTRKGGLPEIDHTQSVGTMVDKITYWREDVDNMQDVFAQADCVVYPAYSDGWGMWPREAACAGLPVLATNATGTAEGCEHWAYPLNDIVWADSPLPGDGRRFGKWAKVRVDEVAHWMRYCYENRDAAQAKGRAAARWIRANQTWQHTADKLLALLELERVVKPRERLDELNALHMRLQMGANDLVSALTGDHNGD